ncbi:MAG TPA: SCO family protein [Cytophagales bacterium]|nr:SCO family protein [Cytophagales bacterium]
MNKFFKIGGLLLLIAVPIFLVILLHVFGKNKYNLRHYFPLEVKEKQVDGKTVSDTVFHKVPNYQLTDQEGKPFSQDQLAGKIYVADFFFTRCGGICPKMTKQLTRVQERFRDVAELKIVSITVDPENDTPEVLRKYAHEYKAKPGFWYFLTGEDSYIYRLAKVDFMLNAMENNTSDEEDFVHSDKLVLVDSERHIRGYYNGTDPAEVDRLMVEIDILLLEKK